MMDEHDWSLLVFGTLMGFLGGIGITMMGFVYFVL